MYPLISVIIPIYNVETFLPSCIESVINQTYENLEIILIDDGSTDKSGKICDKYSENDSRITVIHKDNEGVAEARNTGIENMSGEYFCFVDGDDYVDNEYISEMYSLTKEYDADISMCSYVYKWRDGTEKRTRNTDYSDDTVFSDTGIDALKKLLYGQIYAPSCCGKLFKKDRVAVNFPKYAIGEDVLSCIDYLQNAKKVVMINAPLYLYMQNENSVMHSFNIEKIYDMVKTADIIYEKCAIISDKIKNAATYYLTEKNFIVFMKLYGKNGVQDRINHIKKNIKQYRNVVIRDKNAELRTRIACILSYLGFGALYKIRNAISGDK